MAVWRLTDGGWWVARNGGSLPKKNHPPQGAPPLGVFAPLFHTDGGSLVTSDRPDVPTTDNVSQKSTRSQPLLQRYAHGALFTQSTQLRDPSLSESCVVRRIRVHTTHPTKEFWAGAQLCSAVDCTPPASRPAPSGHAAGVACGPPARGYAIARRPWGGARARATRASSPGTCRTGQRRARRTSDHPSPHFPSERSEPQDIMSRTLCKHKYRHTDRSVKGRPAKEPPPLFFWGGTSLCTGAVPRVKVPSEVTPQNTHNGQFHSVRVVLAHRGSE